MKIRIVDIAKKAGVSVGTVDRIIHKRGKVSEKANEKVQKAIKELGYEPDLLARNLALKKELRIVCLLPDPEETIYWQRPDAGISKAISELASFKVIIERIYFAPRIDSFRESYMKVLDMKADGVIYVPMFFNESRQFAALMTEQNIPFIHVNIHQAEVHPLSFIGQNPIAAGQVAASLCEMALKAQEEILITYISKEKQDYSHHQDRIEGFMQFFELNKNSAPAIHHLHLQIDHEDLQLEKQLTGYLESHPQIRLIYVPNSRAYRIASILKKQTIRDKMIIGFDTLKENVEYLKEGYIKILIGQQSKTQGYRAVMSLFNALFRKEKINPADYLAIDILNRQNIEFYEGILKG